MISVLYARRTFYGATKIHSRSLAADCLTDGLLLHLLRRCLSCSNHTLYDTFCCFAIRCVAFHCSLHNKLTFSLSFFVRFALTFMMIHTHVAGFIYFNR